MDCAQVEPDKGLIDYGRQLDLFSPLSLKQPVTIIGAGGIGSPTALLLSKMGVQNITLYDFDSVEHHNLPNQMFRIRDLGKEKVVALGEVCKEFAGIETNLHNEPVSANTRLAGLVISGVDSMEARTEIWKAVKYKLQIPLYIDARSSGEVCRICMVRPCMPESIALYEKTLHTDESSMPDPCTARAIMYNIFMIASIIGNLVKRFAKGESIPNEIWFDYVNMMLVQN